MVAEANLTNEQKDELRKLLPQAKRVIVNFGERGWAVESVVFEFSDGSRQACGKMFDQVGKEMNLCDETSVKILEGRTWTEVFDVPPGALDLDTMTFEEFDYIVGIEGHGLASTTTSNGPAGLAYDLKFMLASGSTKHVKGETSSDSIFRPPDVQSRDASGQILSWFTTPQVQSMPTSMRLETLCRDQGWGNSKGSLYVRRVWTGGAGEWMKITPSNVPHTSSKLVLDIPVSQFTGRSQQPLQIELGFLVGSGGGHALYLSETKLIVSSPSARHQWKGRPFTLAIPGEKIRSHTFKSIDFAKGTAVGVQLHAPKKGNKYILEWDFAPQIDRLKDPDDLKLLNNVEDAAKWGEERYQGGVGNWPGADGVIAPLRIDAEQCTVRFYSDGSVVYWGWRFVVLPDSITFYLRADPRFRLVEAMLDSLPAARLSLKQMFIPSIQIGATEVSLWLLQNNADRELQSQFSNWCASDTTRWRSLVLDDSQTAFVDGLIEMGWVPKEALRADGLLISSLNLDNPVPMAKRLLEEGAGFKNAAEDLLRTPTWLQLVSSESRLPLVKSLIQIPDVGLPPVDVLVATVNAALKSKAAAISATLLMESTVKMLAQMKPAQQDAFKKDFVQAMLRPATFETLKDLEGARFFESRHPYGNNLDEVTRVKVESARALYVAFDSRTSMETGHDYVQLLTADMKGCWGDQRYSGKSLDFPGTVGGRKPVLRIDAQEFVVKFHTDYSGRDWGWRLVVVDALPQSPWAAVFALMPVWADEHLALLSAICGYAPELKDSVMASGALLAAIESKNYMLARRLINYDCEIDDKVVNQLLKGRPMGLNAWQDIVSYCAACDASLSYNLKDYTPLRPSSLPVSFMLQNASSGKFVGVAHENDITFLTDGGDAIAFSVDVPDDAVADGMHLLKSENKYLTFGNDKMCLLDSYSTEMEACQFQVLLKDGSTDQVVVYSKAGRGYFRADGTIQRIVRSEPTVYTIVSQGASRFYPDYLAWSQICSAILSREAMYLRPDSFLSLQGVKSSSASNFRSTLVSNVMYYGGDKKRMYWKTIASELLKPQSVPVAAGGLASLMTSSSKFSFEKAAAIPGAVVIESKHPYTSCADEDYVVSIPGATALYVAFDERTQTEENWDYVQLLKMNGAEILDETWGAERYSGNVCFPGVGGNSPLRMDGTNKFTLRFHSDGSGEQWGWRAVVWAAEKSSAVPSIWHIMLLRDETEVLDNLLSALTQYKSEYENSGFEEYQTVCELLKVATSSEILCDLATHTSEDRRSLAQQLYDSYGATVVSTTLRQKMLEEDVDGISAIKRLYLSSSYGDQRLAQVISEKDDVLKRHLSSCLNSARWETYCTAARGRYGALDAANKLVQGLKDYDVKSGQVVSISYCSNDNEFRVVAVFDKRLPSRGPLNLQFEFHEFSSGGSGYIGCWDEAFVQEIIERRCVTYEDLVSVCCEEYHDALSSTRSPQPRCFLIVWTCVPIAPEWRLPNERLITGLMTYTRSFSTATRNFAHQVARQTCDMMEAEGTSPDQVLVWACTRDLTRHLSPGFGEPEFRLTRVFDSASAWCQPRSVVVKDVDGPFGGVSGVYELASWSTSKRQAGANMDGYWLIRKPDGNKWLCRLDQTTLEFSSGVHTLQYGTAMFKCKGGVEYALEDVPYVEYGGYSVSGNAFFKDLPKTLTLSADDGHMLTFTTKDKDCPQICWYRVPTEPVYVHKKAKQYSIRRTNVEDKMRWTIVSSMGNTSNEVLFLAHEDYDSGFRPPFTSYWQDQEQTYSAKTQAPRPRYFVEEMDSDGYIGELTQRICGRATRLPRSSGSRSYVPQTSAAGIAIAGGPDYCTAITFFKD